MTKASVIASALLVLLGSTVTGAAGVWEFDRKGRVLLAPNSHDRFPHKRTYVTDAINETRSTRNLSTPATGYAAVYRPMAEGVARVFARDPAIARAGLDAEEFARLFVALIDQESRFNPGAVSPKGARGLGQLMPETAAALGVRDALEPMENLRGAARYLTAQLATFGRVDLALAAYNAGPHRVTQYQGIPPFRETRDYVARITRAPTL